MSPECPHHTSILHDKTMFNWTATYRWNTVSFVIIHVEYYCRQDSTIVTPYESWQYYDPTVVSRPQNINYAAKKTKKVAWFVSNCGARNGRLQYAQELSKYIRHARANSMIKITASKSIDTRPHSVILSSLPLIDLITNSRDCSQC